jgi:hypothetical protein
MDELTPPGIARADRSKIASFDGLPSPRQTVGVQPARSHAAASQNGTVRDMSINRA